MAGLSAAFEQVVDIVGAYKNDPTSPNRFAWVLEKRNQNRGTSKSEKGAALIYAIRCAIAHAGDRNIFYEQYDDADLLVLGILPILEAVIFQFTGISAT
jgi:hypothetical protein